LIRFAAWRDGLSDVERRVLGVIEEIALDSALRAHFGARADEMVVTYIGAGVLEGTRVWGRGDLPPAAEAIRRYLLAALHMVEAGKVDQY
jgi:hypothetical protein